MSRDDVQPIPVHLDDRLLVVDKPAGWLSVPGRGPEKADCLQSRLQARHGPLWVVHRLDQATSGLIAFARDAGAQRLLSAAFAQRRVAKTYVAVVDGDVAGDAGEIDLPLAADWPRRPRQQVAPDGGRPALTRWHVLARGAQRTRLRLEPVTGRTHQLRVHLAAIGHPIAGDRLYGHGDVPGAPSRLLLHASTLGLPHPDHGATVHVECPAPF